MKTDSIQVWWWFRKWLSHSCGRTVNQCRILQKSTHTHTHTLWPNNATSSNASYRITSLSDASDWPPRSLPGSLPQLPPWRLIPHGATWGWSTAHPESLEPLTLLLDEIPRHEAWEPASMSSWHTGWVTQDKYGRVNALWSDLWPWEAAGWVRFLSLPVFSGHGSSARTVLGHPVGESWSTCWMMAVSLCGIPVHQWPRGNASPYTASSPLTPHVPYNSVPWDDTSQ